MGRPDEEWLEPMREALAPLLQAEYTRGQDDGRRIAMGQRSDGHESEYARGHAAGIEVGMTNIEDVRAKLYAATQEIERLKKQVDLAREHAAEDCRRSAKVYEERDRLLREVDTRAKAQAETSIVIDRTNDLLAKARASLDVQARMADEMKRQRDQIQGTADVLANRIDALKHRFAQLIATTAEDMRDSFKTICGDA